MKNWNSIKNQSIKSKFVGREILYCQTSIVEDMLRAGTDGNRDFPSYDDLEGLYNYGEIAGETYYSEEEIDERIEEIEKELSEITGIEYCDANDAEEWKDNALETIELAGLPENDNIDEKLAALEDGTKKVTELLEELEELETAKDNGPDNVAEIYEWWLVTGLMADKLQDQNEIILSWDGCEWWGRQTTGQAILLDGVISRICEEMEILEGQKNEWNV